MKFFAHRKYVCDVLLYARARKVTFNGGCRSYRFRGHNGGNRNVDNLYMDMCVVLQLKFYIFRLDYDLGIHRNVTIATPKVKERKKHDRFNGMPEEEVSKRTLPDHLATNLDIIIVSIWNHCYVQRLFYSYFFNRLE